MGSTAREKDTPNAMPVNSPSCLSLRPNSWRHQWQRAVIVLSVLIVTSAAQPLHLKVCSASASAAMSRAPEAMVVPASVSSPSPKPNCSSTRSACHSVRQ